MEFQQNTLHPMYQSTDVQKGYKKLNINGFDGINFADFNYKERYQLLCLIMYDISENRRRHNQAHFHSIRLKEDDSVIDKDTPINSCETAHCIAGWMAVEQANYYKRSLFEIDDLVEASESVVYDEEYDYEVLHTDHSPIDFYAENKENETNYRSNLEDLSFITAKTWSWAAAVLNLDYCESGMIFSEDYNDIEEIIVNFYDLLTEKYGLEYADEVFSIAV